MVCGCADRSFSKRIHPEEDGFHFPVQLVLLFFQTGFEKVRLFFLASLEQLDDGQHMVVKLLMLLFHIFESRLQAGEFDYVRRCCRMPEGFIPQSNRLIQRCVNQPAVLFESFPFSLYVIFIQRFILIKPPDTLKADLLLERVDINLGDQAFERHQVVSDIDHLMVDLADTIIGDVAQNSQQDQHTGNDRKDLDADWNSKSLHHPK